MLSGKACGVNLHFSWDYASSEETIALAIRLRTLLIEQHPYMRITSDGIDERLKKQRLSLDAKEDGAYHYFSGLLSDLLLPKPGYLEKHPLIDTVIIKLYSPTKETPKISVYMEPARAAECVERISKTMAEAASLDNVLELSVTIHSELIGLLLQPVTYHTLVQTIIEEFKPTNYHLELT